jgi:hypothetical protein
MHKRWPLDFKSENKKLDKIHELIEDYQTKGQCFTIKIEAVKIESIQVKKQIIPLLPIIQEIIEAHQLNPDPIDGKYKSANNNEKEFVHWLVENKYDEYITPENYSIYIYSNVKDESIKRYYRTSRDTLNK